MGPLACFACSNLRLIFVSKCLQGPFHAVKVDPGLGGAFVLTGLEDEKV